MGLDQIIAKQAELDALTSEVMVAPHSVSLGPKQSAILDGRPGKTFRIVIDNNDEDLDAVIYVLSNGKWIYNNYSLASGDTTRKTFQMGPSGHIRVYNWTDNKFSPNPQVTFSLRAVK
ncbi:MAG: hypothetical protein JXR05_16890 [Flavobacteriaceae bacterium]